MVNKSNTDKLDDVRCTHCPVIKNVISSNRRDIFELCKIVNNHLPTAAVQRDSRLAHKQKLLSRALYGDSEDRSNNNVIA